MSIFSQIEYKNFDYKGMKRSYFIHLPPEYSPQEKLPLVLVLHGGMGNAKNIARITSFSDYADKENFIVAYPNGSGRFENKLLTWNAGFCCHYSKENNIDDIGFISAFLDFLVEKYSIDSKRIYATGISNGGMMSYCIGAQLSHKITAIAPVAASYGANNQTIPEPSEPVSILIIHGMQDKVIPYSGGKGSNPVYLSFYSVEDSTLFWIRRNNCIPIAVHEELADGTVFINRYTGGENETSVVTCLLKNGAHAWPGGQLGYFAGDKPTNEINATEIIWEFFKNQRK